MTQVVDQNQGHHRRNCQKTQFHCIFILYNHMDIYEHVQDQWLHNQSTIVNYTTGYICFIKTSKESRKDNTWFEYYMDLTKMNQRLVNTFVNKDFDLIQTDHDYRSAANWYISSKVLGQYFSGLIYKQKNTQEGLNLSKMRNFFIKYKI